MNKTANPSETTNLAVAGGENTVGSTSNHAAVSEKLIKNKKVSVTNILFQGQMSSRPDFHAAITDKKAQGKMLEEKALSQARSRKNSYDPTGAEEEKKKSKIELQAVKKEHDKLN